MEKWEELLDGVDLPTPSQKTYIWGAGNTAELAHEGMIREGLYDYFNVVGFVDSKLSGSTVNGFSVERPSVLESLPRDEVFVLICTGNQWMLNEVAVELARLGIAHSLLDAAVIKVKQARCSEAASLLDRNSRVVYSELLASRMTLDHVNPDLYAGEPYFGIPEFCYSNPRDVMFDCGAYVGDSSERFLWRMDKFRSIYAFEFDPLNYRALVKRFARLRDEWNVAEDRLVPVLAGVDSKTSVASLCRRVEGLSSKVSAAINDGSSGDAIELWAIDDFVRERLNGLAPTYIKADIESYEYRMLEGAREVISVHKPRLAICIYHSAVDMYDIPLLVHSLNGEYQLAVCHHSYSLAETVLYAY